MRVVLCTTKTEDPLYTRPVHSRNASPSFSFATAPSAYPVLCLPTPNWSGPIGNYVDLSDPYEAIR